MILQGNDSLILRNSSIGSLNKLQDIVSNKNSTMRKVYQVDLPRVDLNPQL